MVFRIGFTGELAFDEDEGEFGRMGKIIIGGFWSSFSSYWGYWTQKDYEDQWRSGLRRIVRGATSSCLLTSVAAPGSTYLGSWWLMYRERDLVVFQEGFIHPVLVTLDAKSPYKSVPEYDPEDRVSEWRIHVSDIQAFLDSGPSEPLGFEPPVPWSPS